MSVNRATSITSSIEANRARMRLAELRTGQTQQLAASGAGDKFEAERWAADLEQQRADLGAQIPQLAAAEQEVTAMRAKAASIRERLGAQSGGEQAEVAEIRAEVQEAQWKLNETTMYAPTDGYVINLQLRPGSTVSVLPLIPVMTFVEQGHVILALFGQNELHQVQPGNTAEIALSTYPGSRHQDQGGLDHLGAGAGPAAAHRHAAANRSDAAAGGPLRREARDRPREGEGRKDLFLAAGARGAGAIYTDHLHPIHIIRKVLLRVDAYLNWVIIKHHISLH